MRFYARFACENPHFHTSWYKISYDTLAKKRFLDECDYITRLRLVLQTHTRQKTFHRTRIVMYYFSKFFSNFFSKFVFWGLYSRCSLVYRDKTDSMYLCYEKYDLQANIAGQYSIPITAYKIFSTQTDTTPLVIILP